MSTGRAILIGILWVNGAVLLGFVVPLAAVFGGLSLWTSGPTSVWLGLVAPLAALGLSFVCGWLMWSSQITRWRLWAYRRVDDVDALKTAAVTASLIWPDGHVFERTEFRTRDQREELARLERAAASRPSAPEKRPTRFGTAGKALVFGVILTPVCVLAPAGLLQMMGVTVVNSPIFLSLLVIFPLGLAGLIYRRARRDGVSADEGFRRVMPKWLRAKGDGA